MRLKIGVLLGLMWLAACSEQAGSEQVVAENAGKVNVAEAKAGDINADREAIYFVQQVIKMDGGMPITQSSFSGLSLSRQDDGAQTLRQRTLWSWQVGGGNAAGTLSMKLDDADDKALLDVLAAGFEVAVDKDGGVKEVRAVNQQAMSVLAQRNAEAAAMIAPRRQGTALLPLKLTGKLAVGQEFMQKNQLGGISAGGAAGGTTVDMRLRVTALTDDVAVLDMQLQGEGLRGHGQQAVRRRDGMPIDLQFELVRDATDGMPSSSVWISAVDVSNLPQGEIDGDAAMYRFNRDMLAEQLSKPPFSAPSDDASVYTLRSEKVGELPLWMLSSADLEPIGKHLMFALMGQHDASRPLINMGGKLPSKLPAGSPSGSAGNLSQPVVMAELRKATLLDAAGHELPGLNTVVTYPRIMFLDQYTTAENNVDFPFRLPLHTHAEQLIKLETIRLDVAVETYTPAGTEMVKVGEQPKTASDARISWLGPQRILLEQGRTPFGAPKGRWIIAVPMDAEGKEIPAATLDMGAYVDDREKQGDNQDSKQENNPENKSAEDTLPPLSWEQARLPMQQHVATPRPIAALQLRHYNWEQVPQQWNLRNARNMAEPPK